MINEALEALQNKPLVVYGWNPDSLIASILALKYSNAVYDALIETTTSWRPGLEYLETIAINSREAKNLILIGTGWTGVEIDLLAPMILAPVVVIDQSWMHMLPKKPNVILVNPSPRGDPRANWPSVASLVSMILGNPHPFLAASSILLILGDMARGNRSYQNFMSLAGLDHNLDFELASECAMQAYGVISMGDPKVHREVVRSVIEADPDPCKAMLRDVLITTYRAEAEAALDTAYTSISLEDKGQVRVSIAEGEGRHFLFLARILALDAPDKTILLVYKDLMNKELTGCAWNIKLRKPLARMSSGLRGRGYETYGSYQGPANYICFKGKGKETLLIEDFLEEYSRFGYST